MVKEETYKVECKIKLESVCPEPHNTYTAPHYRPVRDLGHGCYPVPRRSCVKVPVVEARKVPTSSCLPVPDVLCYNVLTPVQDVYCEPVVSRDCRNVSVEVPYIKTESQCDEIVYDECQEVSSRDLSHNTECPRYRWREESQWRSARDGGLTRTPSSYPEGDSLEKPEKNGEQPCSEGLWPLTL